MVAATQPHNCCSSCCTQRPQRAFPLGSAAHCRCRCPPTVSWVSPRSALPTTSATTLVSILPWKVTKAPATGQISSSRRQQMMQALLAQPPSTSEKAASSVLAGRPAPSHHRKRSRRCCAFRKCRLSLQTRCSQAQARPHSGLCSPAARSPLPRGHHPLLAASSTPRGMQMAALLAAAAAAGSCLCCSLLGTTKVVFVLPPAPRRMRWGR